MTLHVPTLLVALLLSVGLFATTLATATAHLQHQDALRRWTQGTWALALAFVLLASRIVIPEPVAVLLGNSVLAGSLAMFADALHRFVHERPVPRWQLALLGCTVLCLVVAMRWPVPLRITLLSVLYAAQVAPTVHLVVRRGWQAERSLRIVGLSMGLTAAALVVRAFHATLYPEQYESYFTTTLGNGLTYLAAFLFPLGAGYGLLLAHLERTANRLQVMATHDALTGCANRGLFDAMLRHAAERARRERSALSLLMLDLDRFKQVNDHHGHPTGDRVLRAVAEVLRERLRASDVLARTGGEEFAVILPGSDAAGARRAAEGLRHAIEALEVPVAAGEPLRVTASIGIATIAAGDAAAGADADALYARADDVLYRAKTSGRNRCLHEADAPQAAPASTQAA